VMLFFHGAVPSGLKWAWIVLYSFLVVRWFMIFHDCGHNSFTPSTTVNTCLMYPAAMMCWSPCDWGNRHRLHHASSGNLDNMVAPHPDGHSKQHYNYNETSLGVTVQKLESMPFYARWAYRAVRTPIFFFIGGAGFQWFVWWRIPINWHDPKQPSSALQRNINTASLAGLWYCVGNDRFFDMWLGTWMGASLGMMLFHAQHTWEDGYARRAKDWSFSDAAFLGSSFIQVPYVMRWFLMGIEYHHIHHYDSHVPGFMLHECHDDAPEKYWAMSHRMEFKDILRVAWDYSIFNTVTMEFE